MINIAKEINDIKNEMALARTNHKMDVYEILMQIKEKFGWNNAR